MLNVERYRMRYHEIGSTANVNNPSREEPAFELFSTKAIGF